jgi:hypothetical protein
MLDLMAKEGRHRRFVVPWNLHPDHYKVMACLGAVSDVAHDPIHALAIQGAMKARSPIRRLRSVCRAGLRDHEELSAIKINRRVRDYLRPFSINKLRC